MSRIYVCDDDAKLVEMLYEVLREAGHSVIGVNDSEALGRLLQGGLPDLAIVDIQMPGGGGPRANAILPIQIPVIVASAMPLRFQKQWFQGRPEVRFLEKPISWRSLEAALRELGLAPSPAH